MWLNQLRIHDFPLVGTDPLGDADLRHGHFSAELYAKMKELGPIGGGGIPPGSANGFFPTLLFSSERHRFWTVTDKHLEPCDSSLINPFDTIGVSATPSPPGSYLGSGDP